MGDIINITPILEERRRFDELIDRPIAEVIRELGEDFPKFLAYHKVRGTFKK